MGKMLLDEDERLLPPPPLVPPLLALRAVVGCDARMLVLGLELAAALAGSAFVAMALVATVWAVTVTAVLG
jgi:hypothetical protein